MSPAHALANPAKKGELRAGLSSTVISGPQGSTTEPDPAATRFWPFHLLCRFRGRPGYLLAMSEENVELVKEFTRRFAAGGHVTREYFDPGIVWDTTASGMPSAG